MGKGSSAIATLAIATAVAIAGCGGGSSSTGSGASPAGAGSSTGATVVEPGPGAFVSLGSVPKLGLVLVDSEGRTLYAFDGDQGSKSDCYGACAKAWPPLLTEGAPQPSNGTSAARLGTTRRKDGGTQVTYAGQPLYTYSGDHGPGEAGGNGSTAFGGRWFALAGSGKAAG